MELNVTHGDATTTDGTYGVLIIGAGFSGLYMAYRLLSAGHHVAVLETGPSVGGTWYWNRYPGLRVDVPSVDYSYSFSEELQQEWEWSEKYSPQPEILAYLNHVADRFDLRQHIHFDTRVVSAQYSDDESRWLVHDQNGKTWSAQFVVTAVGCLSTPQTPRIRGQADFTGRILHTGEWPEAGIDFSGQTVGVIGTGSSGIQVIPEVAKSADHLYVFQRSPHFSLPAFNAPLDPEYVRKVKEQYAKHREEARHSQAGLFSHQPGDQSIAKTDPATVLRMLETAWESGSPQLARTFTDTLTNEASNRVVAEFVKRKIRDRIDDPETARLLSAQDYPFGTKRVCIDTGYYETYNRDNVTLVDVKTSPIKRLDSDGLVTTYHRYQLDAIVFATGYDAMTGALLRMNLVGRNSQQLGEKWQAGPRTYLGLAIAGFPNLFTITGPGSPSVLSNMVISIEQHVEWIGDLLDHAKDNGIFAIEADQSAEEAWVDEVNRVADQTLLKQANSWYLGANIPGKPRVFMPYAGTVARYREICDEVAARGYRGFHFNC